MSVALDVREQDVDPPTPPVGVRVAPLLVPLGALVVWYVAATRADTSAMGDIGLVSVLSVVVLVAPGVLTASFLLRLRARAADWELALHVVALVIMATALPAVAEALPRLPAAWLHVGFVDRLARTGTVVHNYDARFSWPGWFAYAATIIDAAGIRDQLQLVRWTPTFLGLAYLAPLRSIFWWATPNRRARYLALWIAVTANWVGQDYYSPQGFAYLTYLVVIALVLVALRHGPPLVGSVARLRALGLGAEGDDARGSRTRYEPAIVVVLAILVVALAPAHQLTPFALATTLALIAWCGHRRVGALAALTAVAAIAWLSFGALDYWRGHLAILTGGVGQLGSSLQVGVGDRVTGGDAHRFILAVRFGVAGLLYVLAAMGLARGQTSRDTRRLLALCVAAPTLLVALQSYGGEGVLRVYLFALAPLAALSALALTRARPAATVVVCTGMALLIPLTRYGNDRYESVRPEDLAVAEWTYANAPHGSTIVALSENLPWRYQDLEAYRYLQGGLDFSAADDDAVLARLRGCHDCYLVVTSGQIAYGEAVLGRPPGWTDALLTRLVATGYRVRFRDGPSLVVGPA